MKQAVLTQDGFELRDVPVPACGPGEVLVKTTGAGICEGDLHRYRQFIASGEEGEHWMGHEGSGDVVEVGERVGGLEPGDRVTAIGGPFAEHFVVSPDLLALLPDEVDPRRALGEPVSCCLHAAWRFGVRLGDRVAVVGVGFMGQLCLQLARMQGAAHVCVLDLLDWRLPVAERLGADATLNPDGLDPHEVREELGEFDVVIEAAGSASALDICGELVKMHGRMILVGYHQSNSGMRTVPMQMWNYKAGDIIHGHVRNMREKREAMEATVRLMAAGRLDVEPLVTYYPLEDIGQAFRDLADRKEGLFKAVLIPGS